MPDWCDNQLEVSGSLTGIKDFLENCKSDKSIFSLKSLLPIQDENDANWCFDNWGTKSDVDLDSVYVSDITEGRSYSVSIDFDTDWSPAIEWSRITSGNFPELLFRLRYYEPSHKLAGECLFIKGTGVSLEYSFGTLACTYFINYYFDEMFGKAI